MMFRYTRNGGMRFLRIGRIQMSFCLCKRQPRAVQDKPDHMFADGIIATVILASIIAAVI